MTKVVTNFSKFNMVQATHNAYVPGQAVLPSMTLGWLVYPLGFLVLMLLPFLETTSLEEINIKLKEAIKTKGLMTLAKRLGMLTILWSLPSALAMICIAHFEIRIYQDLYGGDLPPPEVNEALRQFAFGRAFFWPFVLPFYFYQLIMVQVWDYLFLTLWKFNAARFALK